MPHEQNGNKSEIVSWRDMIQPCKKETWEIVDSYGPI